MRRHARLRYLHDVIWWAILLAAAGNSLMLWLGPAPPSSDALLISATITLVAVLLREERHR